MVKTRWSMRRPARALLPGAALALLLALNVRCGGGTNLAERPIGGPPAPMTGAPSTALAERPIEGPGLEAPPLPPQGAPLLGQQFVPGADTQAPTLVAPPVPSPDKAPGSPALAEHPGVAVEAQSPPRPAPRPSEGASLAERPIHGPLVPPPPSRTPGLAEHPGPSDNGNARLLPTEPGPPARHGADKATTLIRQANAHWQGRAYARAEPLFREAIALLEKAPARDSVTLAIAQSSLAQIYRELGEYARAATLGERALATLDKALGPDHLTTAEAADNLAWLYWQRGEFGRAEPLAERAFAARERALQGKASAPLIASLSTLGVLRWEKGDYARAEQLLGRARDMAEQLSPRAAPTIAATLDNLGGLYWDKGDYARAEPLFGRALSLREAALGKEDATLAVPLTYLARAALEREDFDRAEALFGRALAIWEKALGKEHPHIAHVLGDLGELYRTKGEHARAEPLLQEALRISEKVFGKEHPAVGDGLDELATLYRETGDHARARPLAERALAIFRASHGDAHPNVAECLNHLASLSLAEGDVAAAIDQRERGAAILDRTTALVLAIGAEEQKRAYMAMLQKDTDATISLHALRARSDPRAAALALTTILRRKGRVLDAMTDGFGALRRRLAPEDRALLDQLASVEARLGAQILRGQGKVPLQQHQASVLSLEEERRALEAQVSDRSAEFRSEQRKVTLDEVKAALPEDTALVEIVVYAPFDEKARTPATRRGEPRYAAYVQKRRGELAFVDLGEAAPLDAAAAELRTALADPTLDPRPRARALDARLMQPIRAQLGGTSKIMLSPDGALNLVPFGALIDERGQYLLLRTSFTYLSSGRELARQRPPAPPQRPAVVLANPAFGPLAAPAVAKDRGGRRSLSMENVLFPPLPGTAAEGRAIGQKIAGAALLTGAAATEGAVKALRGPSIVHIATHGFFLPSPERPAQKAASGANRAARATSQVAGAAVENPLLRAGLAFAGANQRDSGGEDGVLTALEASSIDLRGTQLIVLSACETGVGEAERGEGVYGLRRALSIAGAETQVMSLWKVDDDATRALMVAYYGELSTGGGRSEAMRGAQLSLLAKSGTAHPYYWASFVVSGDGGPLPWAAFAKAGPEMPKVGPGARGCGCAAVGTRGEVDAAFAWGMGVGLVAAARRRRRAALSRWSRSP